MIPVAEVVSPGRVVCRLMGGAHSVMSRMPIQALPASVGCRLEAPLIHDLGTSFNVNAVQLEMAFPAQVSCISAPAVVACEDIGNGDERKQKQASEDVEHDGRDWKGFGVGMFL